MPASLPTSLWFCFWSPTVFPSVSSRRLISQSPSGKEVQKKGHHFQAASCSQDFFLFCVGKLVLQFSHNTLAKNSFSTITEPPNTKQIREMPLHKDWSGCLPSSVSLPLAHRHSAFSAVSSFWLCVLALSQWSFRITFTSSDSWVPPYTYQTGTSRGGVIAGTVINFASITIHLYVVGSPIIPLMRNQKTQFPTVQGDILVELTLGEGLSAQGPWEIAN